jgi:hypothetical protein
MCFAPDFVDGHRLIGLNRASEHFYRFLDARFAKVQLLDLSEDLFQILRVLGCLCRFPYLPHTRILRHPALERDCTIVVPKYNCPAKILCCNTASN